MGRQHKLGNINYKIFFISIMSLSFVIWLLCALIPATSPKALSVFYQSGDEAFYDYYHSIGVAAQENPYEAIPPQGQDHAYPPLAYGLYSIFKGLVPFVPAAGIYNFKNVGDITSVTPLKAIMFGLYFMFAVTLFILVKKQIKSTNAITAGLITIAFLVGKPVLYALERGNIIVLAMLLNAFFIFYYKSENKIIRELALIALSISAGIKLTPAVLGVLLIFDKKWKEAFRTVIYGLVATLAPFLLFKGGFALIPEFLHNMGLHLKSYRITNGTIYGCLQNIRKFYDFEFVYQTVKVAAILCAIVIVLAIPLMKHNWQKVLTISMVLVFAPSVSQFYCLVYIIPALIAFLNETSESRASGESESQTLEEKIVFVLLILIGIMEPKIYIASIAELLIIGYLFLIAVDALFTYFKNYRESVSLQKGQDSSTPSI